MHLGALYLDSLGRGLLKNATIATLTYAAATETVHQHPASTRKVPA